MPKVYEYRGINFYIFPGDHDPPHVHVMKKGSFHLSIEIETGEYKIRHAETEIPTKIIMHFIKITVDKSKYFTSQWTKYAGKQDK